MTEDILSDSHYQESDTIYLYLPYRNEIDTESLVTHALKDGKSVAVPMLLSSGDMVFGKIEDNCRFHQGRYKVIEPIYNPKLVTDKEGLMIVPLVGYHGKNRIGFGCQYYNNYLKHRKNLYTIGVGYKFQEVYDNIEFAEEDIPLDEIRGY